MIQDFHWKHLVILSFCTIDFFLAEYSKVHNLREACGGKQGESSGEQCGSNSSEGLLNLATWHDFGGKYGMQREKKQEHTAEIGWSKALLRHDQGTGGENN